MKSFKRALAVLLCVIMIFGTVAVGGSGFAELFDALSVKASAENYRYETITLTAKCEVESEIVSVWKTSSWWSFLKIKKPFYHVKLYTWLEGLPSDYNLENNVSVEWYFTQNGTTQVITGSSNNIESYTNAQNDVVLAATYELGGAYGEYVPNVGYCISEDDVSNYLGVYYAKLTVLNTGMELDGVSCCSNKIKTQFESQTIYARCDRVRGTQTVNDAGQEEFLEERPDGIADDPLGFYLPEGQEGTDWFYTVKYFTSSDYDINSRTVVYVDNLWHYRGYLGVSYEISTEAKYSYYIKEGEDDGCLSGKEGNDSFSWQYGVNGRGYDNITYTDENGSKKSIRCGTPNWDTEERGIAHYNHISFTTRKLATNQVNAYSPFGTPVEVSIQRICNVGDIIEYGNYPQSDVTATLGSVLNSLEGTWESYTYMRYKDVVYNGNKYRGLTFDTYRPCPRGTYNSGVTLQQDNGYNPGTVYWFKYEPIKWRVLDPSTGLVLCDSIIDSQAYRNYLVQYGEYYYCDLTYSYYANNYAESSIRQWLNNDFYNTAFLSDQKSNIKTSTLNNENYLTISGTSGFEQYDSVQTEDNIFLLSYDEAINSEYGFSTEVLDNDMAKRRQGSDYAKSQGLKVFRAEGSEIDGNSGWWLRTSGYKSVYACDIGSSGTVTTGYYVNSNDWGVCPAMRLSKIKNDNQIFEKHTVTYVIDGEIFTTQEYEFGEAITAPEAPEREGYTFSWGEIPATMPDEDITVTGNYTAININANYHVGDIIEYGNYPQSRVTDETLLTALNSEPLHWKSYNYYSGTGNYSLVDGWNNGNMRSGNYMRYADVVHDGKKYRAVMFAAYRPYNTGYESSAENSIQDDNGYIIDTTYWFEFEPVEWRVLDTEKGFVICNSAIDSQAYNNFVALGEEEYGSSVYWGDPEQTCYASNYAESSIRKWLNNDFYNTAFSDEQKANIVTSTLNNNCRDSLCGNSEYEKYDSISTQDNIFLLSWDESLNSAYGFNSNSLNRDASRRIQGSDYAKCQGLFVYDNSSNPADENTGNSWWYLRTAYDSGETCYVGYSGNSSDCTAVDYTYYGICPAMSLEQLKDDSFIDFGVETYSITYIIDGETYDVREYEFGEIVNAPEPPERDGYTFSWDEIPATMPDENITVYGTYTEISIGYKVGDIIEFGCYPQSLVTDPELLEHLNYLLNVNTPITWQSYNYYSGNDKYDGKMESSNYMRYTNRTYSGEKYRAVNFYYYRPVSTSMNASKANANNSNQPANGYNTGLTYWFKYEPLKWRILDPDTGLAVCESIVDSQAFHNWIEFMDYNFNGIQDDNEFYGVGSHSYHPNTYSYCSLKNWLNDSFIDLAFTSEQKSLLLNNGKGKVFLLSKTDVVNTSYGFHSTISEDSLRRAYGTDYAKCQGLLVNYNEDEESYGCSEWRLRDAGDASMEVYQIDASGTVTTSRDADRTDKGIRPAIILSSIVDGPKYTITYVVDNEVLTTQEYVFGETIIAPEVDEREGYYFSWNDLPETMPARDITIYGEYKSIYAEYSVETRVENLDGTYEITTETLEEVIGTVVEATSSQKTRTGFKLDENASVLEITVTEDGNAKLIIVLNRREYDFIIEDASGTKTLSFKFGAPLTEPEPAEKTGHVFTGWKYQKKVLFYTTISSLPETMPAASLKATANYEPAKYTITYIIDGEVYQVIENVEFGSAITAIDAPEREGYTFSGWSQIPATMPAYDLTVTGSFEATQSENYTVTYIIDGEVYATQEYAFGEAIVAPEVDEREGYTFSWGSVPATMPASNLNIYGIYNANTYRIRWIVDGTTMSQNVKCSDPILLPDNPEKTGFTFTGWTPDVPDVMPANDLEFTATWIANIYTITWVVEGIETEQTLSCGDPVSTPDSPSKEGYIFAGWSPDVPDTMPAENLTFYARFTPRSYKLTYVVNGVKTYEMVNCDSRIETPSDPIVNGYRFERWEPSIPEYMPAYDITITAILTPDYIIIIGQGEETIEIDVGEEKQLDISVDHEPDNPLTYTWESEDEDVASVDENGVITGEYCGETEITVTTDDGTSASVTVIVNHRYNDETVDPTCTEDGYTKHTCSVCGNTYNDSYVDALGHDFKDEEVESSCTGGGYTKHVCQRCGYEYTDNTSPANGHTFRNDIVDPTCTEKGYILHTCTVCGYSYISDESPAKGHTYKDTTVEPTCDEQGYTEHKCEDCGDTYIDTYVPSSGHSYTVVTVVEPTCTAGGYTLHKCAHCDDSYRTDETPAKGHDFNTLTQQATCTQEGGTVYACKVCGFAKIDNKTPALGHDYVAKVTVATCESDGYTTYTCSRCGNNYTENGAPATGHNYEPFEIHNTCIQDGCVISICSNCGRAKKSDVVPAIGHNFGNWTTVREATQEREGLSQRRCSNCGYTEDRIIPMLERTSFNVTFVADGKTVATVEYLKDATSIEEPAVPHKDRYEGKWSEYTLDNTDITVYAEYTLIDLDTLSGLESGKTATYNTATGEATINLYAASEGKTVVSTTSEKVPLDIVLVVDQSGSMTDKLGGNKTKQQALKDAATDFVNAVYADASENDVDHRIAIVGFGMGSQSAQGYSAYYNTEILTTGGNPVQYNNATANDYANALMLVNNGGVNADITSAIANIDADGATAADYGLSMANSIFANTDGEGRQRIVVFMTDGAPTYRSEFSKDVANSAILQANQLKNTYGASVYSVGVMSNSEAANGNIDKFMNYVSSNYAQAENINRIYTKDNDSYYNSINNTNALSGVFTEIVTENITRTTDFDNITVIDTISKYFTLTEKQEKALRINAIETYGVKNSDITVNRNEDGTTTVIICNIHPIDNGSKFEVSLSFTVSANENALKAGTYSTNTEDAGIIIGECENYECVFDSPEINIPYDRTISVFKINGEIFEIKEGTDLLVLETDFIGEYEFTGWNLDSGNEVAEGVTEYSATYVSKQDYIIVWNTDEGTARVTYTPGQVIDEPEVGLDSDGNAFRRWNGEVPVTMPAQTLEFTAVYGDHEHHYDAEIITPVTCLENGTTRYTCSICGKTYTETVVCPGEHTWVAVAGSAGEETGYEEFECETCGEHCRRTLEYTLTDTSVNAGGGYNSITTELNYVDVNGNNTQPDGNVNIVVPVSDFFDGAENVDVYRIDDDGNRIHCESNYEYGVISFWTNHFSTYEFVATYECTVTGNHIDENNDGRCDSCGEAMTYTKEIIIDGEIIGEVSFTYGDTELSGLPDVPSKTGYNGEWEYTINGSELDIHPKYTLITYYATFMADGSQVGNKVPFTVESTSITEPAVPAKDGYTGKWSNYTLSASNVTIKAVYTEIPNPTKNAKISVKSDEVYKNSKVTVIAKASNVPTGYVLAIFDGGSTPVATGDNKSVTYELPELVAKDKSLTVKIIDADKKVQKNGEGKELSAKIEIKVKTGFFDLIIAFFKKLFGANKVTIKP